MPPGGGGGGGKGARIYGSGGDSGLAEPDEPDTADALPGSVVPREIAVPANRSAAISAKTAGGIPELSLALAAPPPEPTAAIPPEPVLAIPDSERAMGANDPEITPSSSGVSLNRSNGSRPPKPKRGGAAGSILGCGGEEGGERGRPSRRPIGPPPPMISWCQPARTALQYRRAWAMGAMNISEKMTRVRRAFSAAEWLNIRNFIIKTLQNKTQLKESRIALAISPEL